MPEKNKIAELASRGFKILRVKLVTLEEDCGFALVSLWRERTEEDTKSRRFRSKAPAGCINYTYRLFLLQVDDCGSIVISHCKCVVNYYDCKIRTVTVNDLR